MKRNILALCQEIKKLAANKTLDLYKDVNTPSLLSSANASTNYLCNDEP